MPLGEYCQKTWLIKHIFTEKNNLIIDTFNHIQIKAFQKKLLLFYPQLKNNNVHFFPLLKELKN